MNETTKQVAGLIADLAPGIAAAVVTAAEIKIDDQETAEAAVDRVIKQSPMQRSERIWSAALGLAASAILAALLAPETQAAVTAWLTAHTGVYAPVLIPLGGALLAYLSKRNDPRPTR